MTRRSILANPDISPRAERRSRTLLGTLRHLRGDGQSSGSRANAEQSLVELLIGRLFRDLALAGGGSTARSTREVRAVDVAKGHARLGRRSRSVAESEESTLLLPALLLFPAVLVRAERRSPPAVTGLRSREAKDLTQTRAVTSRARTARTASVTALFMVQGSLIR